MIPNPFKRPAPHKQPLFAPSTLKLSEKVHWLAQRGPPDHGGPASRRAGPDLRSHIVIFIRLTEPLPSARGVVAQ